MTRRPPEASIEATTDPQTEAMAPSSSPPRIHGSSWSGLAQRRVVPRTRAEVEQHYVAARDAWTAAMKAANSGRTADLAALAMAQEAYETAAAERQRWEAGGRVAIPIEPEGPHPDLGAVVGQELAWRQVHSPKAEPNGIFGRIRRRFRRK